MASNGFSNLLDLMVYAPDRAMTGRDYMALVEKTLRLCGALLECTTFYAIAGLRRSIEIAPDFSNLEAAIARAENRLAFRNPDPTNKRFTPDSTIIGGFACGFSSDKGEPGGRPRIVSIKAGEAVRGRSATLGVEFWREPSAQEALSMFRELAVFWGAVDGFLRRIAHGIAIEGKMTEHQLGWLTLLPFDETRFAPPPGFTAERLGQGMILRASEEIPAADDGAVIERMRQLKLALAEAGLLLRAP